jgi:ferredoxin-NADP reductase
MPIVQKVCCVVEDILDHGLGVYTLTLRPLSRLPRFRPGQFLHLTLDDYDPSTFWPESRVFSIASSPTALDHLTVSYSVKGEFTRRMEREIQVGKRIWVKLPFGDFFIRDDNDVVLYAGGTGISAFTAYIESLKSESAHNICLFYGTRSPELLIFTSVIQQSAQTAPYFQPYFFVESQYDPAGAGKTTYPDPGIIKQGRLSIPGSIDLIPNPFKADYYLSGPPVMLASLTDQLKSAGVAETKIHIDAW